ncbi:hypothetical protein NE865_03656 [Phthorimaea operculella]|nr:hypothetical protein NE865_03656 [Phthorimaea operculella]
MKSVLLVLTSSYLASCLPPPHPAVVQVRREEEQLPFYLRSRTLWNPNLQEVLPLSSLLHEGETPVFEREADHVSRQEIYNILTHAGFLRRRPPHQQPDPHHIPHQRSRAGQKKNHNHGHQNFGPPPPQFGGQDFGGHHFGSQDFGGQHFGGQQPGSDHDLFGPFLGNPEILQYL